MNLTRAIVAFLALVLALIYALPSFYSRQSALEVSWNDAQKGDETFQKIHSLLLSSKIESLTTPFDVEKGKQILTFQTPEKRQQAINLLRNETPSTTLTLSSISKAPSWLYSLGARPINLGLDLQGGVMFLLRVDTKAALQAQLTRMLSESESILITQGLSIQNATLSHQKEEDTSLLSFVFDSKEDERKAKAILVKNFGTFNFSYEEKGASLELTPTKAFKKQTFSSAISQNLIALRNRINELGVSEPIIRKQGSDHILIQLPGVQDPTQAKKIIGATATVSFYLQAKPNTPLFQTITYPKKSTGEPVQLERAVIASGENISNASSGLDKNGRPEVDISLDGLGGKKMGEVTQKNIGRPMAVLYSETKLVTEKQADGKLLEVPKTASKIISLATIQGAFSNQFRITGVGSIQEATNLALLLRAGSLSAPIYFEQEEIIGPSLGADNVRKGLLALTAGMLLVVLVTLLIYRGFGLAACLGLALNILMIVSLMSLLGATLTLSGIAGLVLNIGMAIDANVLNFSRVKEELEQGKTLGKSLLSGFQNSFSAIFDSNITTLLVAVALYSIGSGSVKGFAVTLAIGLLSSLFSALVFSRSLLEGMVLTSNIQHRKRKISWLI